MQYNKMHMTCRILSNSDDSYSCARKTRFTAIVRTFQKFVPQVEPNPYTLIQWMAKTTAGANTQKRTKHWNIQMTHNCREF